MNRAILFAVCMAFSLSCRWNSSQQAVYDQYARMCDAAENHRYFDLYNGLNGSTRELLDKAAEAFSSIGMPIENRGDVLLGEIVSGHSLFQTGANVADIFVRDDQAFLDPARGGRRSTITFTFEEGRWRMDLTREIAALLADALQGTGSTLEAFLNREPAEAVPLFVTGDCRVIISNALENTDIYYVFVSPSASDNWGPDILGTRILLPESACTVFVQKDSYDMMAIDAFDNTYSRWSVALGEEGYDWSINRSDLYQQ